MYNKSLKFHFTGIGGSGMSGIAEVLLSLGFKVSGSDIKNSPVIDRLKTLGAKIEINHDSKNIPSDASLLVYSSAIKADNPELEAARARELPIVRRAEVLAELMRLKHGIGVAGSHGKTTTTSMIAAVLQKAALDPTVIIGGQVKGLNGSGARVGRGEFLVAETDESDRSFLLLRPDIAIVTNIDAEHLDAYGTIAQMEEAFSQFISQVPFYGLAIFCIDDPRVRQLYLNYNKRKISFGLSPDADIRAKDLIPHKTGTRYKVYLQDQYKFEVNLPVLGRHMASNSLAAVAVGLELGIKPELINQALCEFAGVGRRLEVVGESGGVTVMNDYGHHPTEIRATLNAIRSAFTDQIRNFHVIFQPHRYSRTKSSFVDFIEAFQACDNLVITEIYSASESPIDGISGEKLCDAIAHPAKRFVSRPEDVIPGLKKDLRAGDLVLCLGAGSIGSLPDKLLTELGD